MANREKVLSFVRNNPGRTQQEISRSLGITPVQQVYQILSTLMDQGRVYRSDRKPFKYYPGTTNAQTATETHRTIRAEEHNVSMNITRDNTLIVIACTRRKSWAVDHKAPRYAPAKEAYTGGTFQWLKKNQQEVSNFPWIILSAKYGFIEPEHPIHNYDVTFNKPDTGPISIESLKNQVLYQPRLFDEDERKLCDFDYVLVKENRGEAYTRKCKEAFPSTTVVLKLNDALWRKVIERIGAGCSQ